jgi:hypothetical protein
MRVLDNSNTIVASSLEQTTWLRKNLQVRVPHTDVQSIKTTSINNSQPISTGMSSSNETGHLPIDDPTDFDGTSSILLNYGQCSACLVTYLFDK